MRSGFSHSIPDLENLCVSFGVPCMWPPIWGCALGDGLGHNNVQSDNGDHYQWDKLETCKRFGKKIKKKRKNKKFWCDEVPDTGEYLQVDAKDLIQLLPIPLEP